MAAERVPVTVLTGFLGAGKTTLLNRLLREPHGLRIAVVVNEFGEVGIDGRVLGDAEQFVELANGCLCCTVNAELETTLAALRRRGGFDLLVVETTGLADPLAVAWTFERPGLQDFYRVDAIVAVVDALNLTRALAETPEAMLQIERADVILLSKLDLVDDGGAAARARLDALDVHAPILPASGDELTRRVLLPRDDRIADGPGHAAHAPSFDTWTFVTRDILDEAALERALYELPRAVYRVKGIVRTDGEARWTLVHRVAGRFSLEPFTAEPEPDASALVFIGRDLDRDALRATCERLVRSPRSVPTCTVDVWTLDPADVRDDGLLARYRALLSDDERAQLARYRVEKVGHQYLLSRALTRTVLGSLLDVPPEQVAFTKTAAGRPELATGGLRFNLSHTDGLIALAVVADYAVGVDVERYDRDVDPVRLAERFFAPSERDAILAADDATRRRTFVVHWTLKEAFLKARGVGLSEPLDSAAFRIDGPVVRASIAARDEAARCWSFASFEPTTVHRAAVAVCTPTPIQLALGVRRTVPLAGSERTACRVIATGSAVEATS